MTSNEIRQKFLEFFEKKGHKIVPSSSLVPENDPSVLFTTAGMQQFKPYYLGEKSPYGDRAASVQKCVRTSDIDEVGDNTHLTFFEMLGNFSFGGYGKKEAINYAYEFITKELKLEISYVTFYKGAGSVRRDEESAKIWTELGIKDVREEGSDVFWGPTGDSGPCGPTTEIYCKNAAGQDVEIWNIVFNQYFCEGSREQLDKGQALLKELPVLGIDTGMGLERLLTIIQKKESVYETDLFNNERTKEEKIVADHVKAALFMISDGVEPSNKGQGYVLRRLLRKVISLKNTNVENLVDQYINKYKNLYSNVNKDKFIFEFNKEQEGYEASLLATRKELKDRIAHGPIPQLTGYVAFGISSTLGARPEYISDTATELNIPLSPNFNQEWESAIKEHQEKSRTASAGLFKGGLADHEPKTIRLHTAHHLLLAALKKVLGENVKQKGSNITQERLRLDFAFDRKMTDEEKKKVEDLVNEKIKEGLSVVKKEMPKAEAEKLGAEMEFGAKYGDIVSVYFIGDFSIEFCGGPHISNTSELGHFKIQKEEAVSAGTRRIKAVLE